MSGAGRWGVTVLQANAEMDAGDIWSSAEFAMPRGSKSSVYRTEAADAALDAVLQAVTRFEGGGYRPEPLDYRRPGVTGRLRPPCRQDVCRPLRQKSQALSCHRNDATTRSPTFSADISEPRSSMMPRNSCPIGLPCSAGGIDPFQRVRWLAADITQCAFELEVYDVWHDRAVFHFLAELFRGPLADRTLCSLQSIYTRPGQG